MATSRACRSLGLLFLFTTSCAPLLTVPDDIADRYPIRAANLNQQVDFHNHTVLKPYCQEITNPGDVTKLQDAATHAKAWHFNTPAEAHWKNQGLFSSVSTYRQSAWHQLGSYGLICTSIYPSEKALATDGDKRYREVKPAIWQLITGASKARVEGMVKNWSITPFDEFELEYKFLKAQKEDSADARVFVVHSKKDLLAHVQNLQPRRTGLVLSVEGGHTLIGKSAQGTRSNNRLLVEQTLPVDRDEMLVNIRRLKNWPDPVFFITFSHMIWNKLSANGNALDTEKNKFAQHGLRLLATKGRFRRAALTQPNTGIGGISAFTYDDDLRDINTAGAIIRPDPNAKPRPKNAPYDNGSAQWVYHPPLTLGRLALTELLSRRGGRRILPDMRHSSIKTRLDYYYLLDSLQQADGETIPVLFSHAAASGESLRLATLTGLRPYVDDYDEIDDPADFYQDRLKAKTLMPFAALPRYNRYFKGQNDTTRLLPSDLPAAADLGWFQPGSVNLADEEMDIVCRSGGLVGLTMEQRALGTSMSRWEDDKQFGRRAVEKRLQEKLDSGLITVHTKDGDRGEFIRRFLIVAPFVRNLTHLVQVTSPQHDPWQHIGIGSDFDGLIDPLDYFHTSDRLPELEQFLIDYFDLYCQVYHLPRTALLTRGGHTYTVAEAMRRVFSLNGIRFITQYFPE